MTHTIIGKWKRLENPPRCGSTPAHASCRFAESDMGCSASPAMYDACPYHQSGNTVAVYGEEKADGHPD